MPTLLYKEVGLVKGVRFDSWRRVGSAMQAVKVYNLRQVDELVLLDIRATLDDRGPDLAAVDELADECFMPLTVGGGVRTIEDVRSLLMVGADKVAINTGAIENPGLIREVADRFGSQCAVVSIDARLDADGPYEVIRTLELVALASTRWPLRATQSEWVRARSCSRRSTMTARWMATTSSSHAQSRRCRPGARDRIWRQELPTYGGCPWHRSRLRSRRREHVPLHGADAIGGEALSRRIGIRGQAVGLVADRRRRWTSGDGPAVLRDRDQHGRQPQDPLANDPDGSFGREERSQLGRPERVERSLAGPTGLTRRAEDRMSDGSRQPVDERQKRVGSIGEARIWRGDEHAATGPDHLTDEATLIGDAADMLDHRVGEADVELAVLERQISAVGHDEADRRAKALEGRHRLECRPR